MATTERQVTQGTIVTEILQGLRSSPKHLSCTLLYDEAGLALFERICALPEYYLTRVELAILRAHAGTIADTIGPDALLIDLGGGAGSQARVLLDAMPTLTAYMPVTVSYTPARARGGAIASHYHALEVMPVCADFTAPFRLPPPRRPVARKVVFLPGAAIGNFETPSAIGLLRRLRTLVGGCGSLLVGVDLLKDPEVLERAYDDSLGLTAAFNLNVLRRLNQEFGCDFNVQAFRHQARWIDSLNRVEMRLVSTARQAVRVDSQMINIDRGEYVRTELCHKYSVDQFITLARAAGWNSRAVFTDRAQRFSVHYFEASA